MKLEETKGGELSIKVVSQLITQQLDPLVAIERELKVKLDPETKEKLREISASEPTYKEKVQKMLNFLKEKYA